MPLGLGIYDLEGELVHANPHFGRIVSSPALPSRDRSRPARWQGYGPDGSELAIADYPCERALNGENVSPGVDLLHFGANDDARWLSVSAAPIVDPLDQGIVGVVLLLLEVQDRAPASTFAVRADRRFRQFAENSGAAIWTVDIATGLFSYRNPLHFQLFDSADDVMRDLPGLLDHVGDRDRAAVLDCHERALLGRTGRIEYRLKGAGTAAGVRLQETVFPITDDHGEISMIGGMAMLVEDPVCAILYLVGSGATGSLARAARVKRFASLADLLDVGGFLASGCVIVDAATTPDFETHLARTLACHARTLPTIIIGEAETPAATAIAAMRAGAADYLIPPVAERALEEALASAAARLPHPEPTEVSRHADRLVRLSPREREVLTGLVRGGTNKSIARDLGISSRTVELHRSHLMERMNVRTLAGLLQAAHGLGL
jgi:FixJ family two-component response regulator/PAS domain-containing protein